ncbi:hypothetical protein JTB14_029978 [Gonioctena quinquepunctata]|nr:hypothetical protein JTB14_029978 [Gonioctena quinquepunctata]
MSMSQQCLDEISNKFDTLFEQSENYEKTNMDRNSKGIPTPKNLMECQSDSVGKCMNFNKIMNKFDTLFEQAENYEKTNIDRNSKVIPTPNNLMECQSYSVINHQIELMAN